MRGVPLSGRGSFAVAEEEGRGGLGVWHGCCRKVTTGHDREVSPRETLVDVLCCVVLCCVGS